MTLSELAYSQLYPIFSVLALFALQVITADSPSMTSTELGGSSVIFSEGICLSSSAPAVLILCRVLEYWLLRSKLLWDKAQFRDLSFLSFPNNITAYSINRS